MRFSQRGFSLVEMVVAMALAVFLVSVSAGVHLSNVRVARSMENRVSLTQDSLLLIDYLRYQLLTAGGGSIRAWMGIWVEDNCAARSVFPACGGSDRLTITSITTPVQECSITNMVSANVLQIAFASPGVCCLQPRFAGEVSFTHKNIVTSLNDFFRQRYVSSVDLNTCRLTFQPGQGAGGDRPGAVVNWTGGMVSMVTVDTFYWDPATRFLQKFTDLNNNGNINETENLIVADNIFDFQIALGYDFNPGDGNITRSVNGLADEWMHNAPSATEAEGVSPFVTPFSRTQLHMVSIGAILGASDSVSDGSRETSRVLNGPQRSMPGWVLQPEFSQVTPRSSFVFQ